MGNSETESLKCASILVMDTRNPNKHLKGFMDIRNLNKQLNYSSDADA